MNICAIDGCSTEIGRHGAKGYCSKHYKRYKKHGDAAMITRVPDGSSVEESLRFKGWAVTPSGCWEINGGRDADGYGYITKDRVRCGAHRASYETWVGPIPEGHLVRHACDNPPCMNPAHLLTGLPMDNSQDAVERQRMANGERHAMHKLTDLEVHNIRREYEIAGITQRGLARKYGCSQAQISNILLGRQRQNDTHRIAA